MTKFPLNIAGGGRGGIAAGEEQNVVVLKSLEERKNSCPEALWFCLPSFFSLKAASPY